MRVPLREAIFGIPEQVRDSRPTRSLLQRAGAPPRPVEHVLFTGMGGSGMAAEIALSCARPPRGVPIGLVRGYELPAWVSSATMVVGVSHSGETEETLSVIRAARDRGAMLTCVTAGGTLSTMESDGALVLPVPGGMMPRAALGSLAATCALLLEHLGMWHDAHAEMGRTADHLAARRDQHGATGSDAATIARQLVGAMPIVMGGGAVGATAAARWKADLNENAKVQAAAVAIPEANHNDLCAWAGPNDALAAVLLRHADEHPRVERRFELLRPVFEASARRVLEVRAQGATAFGRLLDLALTGSFVSLELADALGVDPEPIPLIDDLKAGLMGGDEGSVAA
jgi:glucose/mannose-6-phosphate isomerase